MKRIYLYWPALLLCAALGLQSCELTSEVYDKINASIYPKTERDARDLVIANAYGPFQNDGYTGAFNIATGSYLTSDVASDYGFCSWGGGVWNGLQQANFDKAEDRNTTSTWGRLNEISKMTLCIDRIEGINMGEKLKEQYIAELRCGRGFMAFLVWDMHGPIIVADLETLKDPLSEKILPRMTNEETIAYIETELSTAAKVLPKNYKNGDADYGKFTAGLCHTLLMKLYMQSKQWGKAIAEGRELMKPEYGYALVKDKGAEVCAYANIFTQANEKNAETIWAVNCEEGFQFHLWYPHVLVGNLFSSVQGSYDGGWGGYKMMWNFFKTFEPGDQRTSVIISEYKDENNTYNEANKGSGANSLQDGVIPLKYKIETSNVGDHCVTDWIVYRYADVLTLMAEAIVHDGKTVTTEAISLLNEVRTRAGLNAYTAADFSSTDDFIDKLLWERAHELWYEGCRRQDLIRNNQYVSKLAQKCRENGWKDVIAGKGEIFHLFPLPASAINEGQGLIKNNPGY